MSKLIRRIQEDRESILIGEIGALLHDIGKLHPDFIRNKSIEKTSTDYHSQIGKILPKNLVNLIKNQKFQFSIQSHSTKIYDMITEHHNNTSNKLIKLLKSCDRLDSADDKGIVRKKQSQKATFINSPFGYKKEMIDLDKLNCNLNNLTKKLMKRLSQFINNDIQLCEFRQKLLVLIEKSFKHGLGESRCPSNDVTLWDHSHSTASLFKSILTSLLLGANPKHQDLKWRILGFCWNGLDFINKGKKIADILKRNEILVNIKQLLRKKFEVDIPIGNYIYKDNNGIYFTFPLLDKENNKDKSFELAKECAKKGLRIIRKLSNNEVYPFFVLSRESRTLTTISEILNEVLMQINVPKISPTLFIENEKISLARNPVLLNSENKAEICPICQFRTQSEEYGLCKICKKRSEGRLKEWLSNRQSTIWLDEIADINNRIALLTLGFNLKNWLNGTMIGTILSQNFDDWIKGKNSGDLRNKFPQIKPRLEDIYELLKLVLDNNNSMKQRALIFKSFFEKNPGIKETTIINHIKNIRTRIEPLELNNNTLSRWLFTQNPSPARIYRIWNETKDFFNLLIEEIKKKVYSVKWKRIKFKLNINSLDIYTYCPYLIKIRGLEPEFLSTFHSEKGYFYTIESLKKFKFNNEESSEAVKLGLRKGINYIAYEDTPESNLLRNKAPLQANIDDIKVEEYFPFIEISKSPTILRIVVSAQDCIDLLKIIIKLYNERFEHVLGKLPLNLSLLVSKRKFPFYSLIEADKRMICGEKFNKTEKMDCWWKSPSPTNNFYSYYPIKKLGSDGFFNLRDLKRLSKGCFALFPGYFDFDLLLATTDRYKIVYNDKKKRAMEEYKKFSSRPLFFYQLSLMMDLWDILTEYLSNSQIIFIEEMLMRKLREWNFQNENNINKTNLFREYARATLKDAFAGNWSNMRIETQDFLVNSALDKLLLDTIIFYRHIIKI